MKTELVITPIKYLELSITKAIYFQQRNVLDSLGFIFHSLTAWVWICICLTGWIMSSFMSAWYFSYKSYVTEYLSLTEVFIQHEKSAHMTSRWHIQDQSVIYKCMLTHIPRIHKRVSNTPPHHSRNKTQCLFIDQQLQKMTMTVLLNTYSFLACFPSGLVFSVAQETVFHWSGRVYVIHGDGECIVLSLYRWSSNSTCIQSVIARATGCELLNSVKLNNLPSILPGSLFKYVQYPYTNSGYS